MPRRQKTAQKTAKKTLVFHIGDRKTGSTAIQYAFACKHVTLTDQSLSYPTRMAHNYLRDSFVAYTNPKRQKRYNKAVATFEGLAKKVAKARANISLISAEMFEGVDPALFQEVVSRFFADTADEIRVVAYVRPHSARLLSSFTEHLKNGNHRVIDGDLNSFFDHNNEHRRFHYLPRFSAWQDLYGDKFTLRPMIRDQLHQGSVIADFTRYGLGQEAFEIKDTSAANQSMCVEDMMRVKVLQTALADHPQKLRHAFGWQAARILDELPPLKTRTKLRLHRSLAEQIHSTYLEDARAMDQRFFPENPLLEAELDKVLTADTEAPQSMDPLDWLDPGDIRSLELTSAFIAEVTWDNPEKWIAHWRAGLLEDRHNR